MVRMRFSVIERVPAFTFNDKCRRQTNERNLVELFVPPSVPYRQRRHCSNDRFPSTVDVLAHNGGDDSRRRRHPRGHHPIPMLASSCCDKYIVVVCRDEMKTPLTSVRGFFANAVSRTECTSEKSLGESGTWHQSSLRNTLAAR
jgi:hypothetical protein